MDSIIDQRLFSQVYELIKNYKRPILIIEGSGNLFAVRNVHKNIIFSSLSSLAVDFRLPIIFTQNEKESVEFIENLAKRVNKEKKDVQFKKKSAAGVFYELENFVSQIPKVNVSTSKILLENFKTIKNLTSKKAEDFEKVLSVGKIRAKFLEEFFNREYKS